MQCTLLIREVVIVEQSQKKEVDAFTQHVMSRIDSDVFRSLNLVQLEAVREAISANAPFKRHPIDLRFSIPLFFMTFYFVMLIGKDRRSGTRSLEERRLHNARAASWLAFLYMLLSVMIPIILILLYIIKSFLGIDFFPDKHLVDWF